MAEDLKVTGTAMVKAPDGTELTPLVETSATAGAALAEARVRARSVVAMGRPRSMDTVRVRLLADCRRPGFAEVARYSIPRGGKAIEGPSIRFAEAAARALGNLDVFVEVIFDDAQKRILQVTAVDLESNHSESAPVVVEKVMERKRLNAGDVAIGTRTTSTGGVVYLVAVPESEMPIRQGAAVSKVRRNLILAHLPGDILEEAQDQAVATMRKKDAEDPDAARKKLADSFAAIGILPDALATYIGADLSAASPAQLADLRAVYVAVREGSIAWADLVADKAGTAKTGAAAKVDALRKDLDAKAAKKKGAAAPPPAAGAAPAQDGAQASQPGQAAPALAEGPVAAAVAANLRNGEQVDPLTGEVVPAPAREPGGEG